MKNTDKKNNIVFIIYLFLFLIILLNVYFSIKTFKISKEIEKNLIEFETMQEERSFPKEILEENNIITVKEMWDKSKNESDMRKYSKNPVEVIGVIRRIESEKIIMQYDKLSISMIYYEIDFEDKELIDKLDNLKKDDIVKVSGTYSGKVLIPIFKLSDVELVKRN